MIENVNILPKEEFHTTAKVEINDSFVQHLSTNNEYKELAAKYSLKLNEAEWHYFRGIATKTLLIPIYQETGTVNKFVAVYYDVQQIIKKIKVMTIEKIEHGFSLAFSNAEETHEVKGVYQYNQYVETQVNGLPVPVEGQITANFDLSCLQTGFEGLPLWLKAFCSVACGAIWTGAGAAACAGCLVGLGIDC
ncbi:hypothetical protein [Paenibacillus sp. AN1007]|uniref:Uncharacterized protein n=1 Tax=Paenibacillus sp. AN1007 TaxID=3151385 RepID=A0AAU8NCX1_9BACL